MTRQEYEEIIKTEHGKSMLRSIYVLAKLDKTNEIWDSKGNLKPIILERITLKEGVLYLGIGGLIIGSCITGLGIYAGFAYGIGAAGAGAASIIGAPLGMFLCTEAIDWSIDGKWPKFWWQFWK